MKFRTEIPTPQYPFEISYESRLMFLGSCFSEHISDYFSRLRFNVVANPFGILFNPLSIAMALDMMMGKNVLDERYFHYFNEKWLSFAHHGKFSHPEKPVFEQNIRQSLQEGSAALRRADILFITLGTAFYYFHAERQLIVANCHKIPAAAFEKRRASIADITRAFDPFFAWRTEHNPDLKIVFTVSPVRHLADGFHENQLSKSTLHLAIEEMTAQNAHVFYFPSYEMFQDDLRDYRFYGADLCHPGEEGLQYVWEKVVEAFLLPSTQQRMKEVEKEVKRAGHIRLSGNA